MSPILLFVAAFLQPTSETFTLTGGKTALPLLSEKCTTLWKKLIHEGFLSFQICTTPTSGPENPLGNLGAFSFHQWVDWNSIKDFNHPPRDLLLRSRRSGFPFSHLTFDFHLTDSGSDSDSLSGVCNWEKMNSSRFQLQIISC